MSSVQVAVGVSQLLLLTSEVCPTTVHLIIRETKDEDEKQSISSPCSADWTTVSALTSRELSALLKSTSIYLQLCPSHLILLSTDD